MEYYLLKLASCTCGNSITVDQMIAQDRVRCNNCPAEYEIHIDLTYIPTLEEWEQMQETREGLKLDALLKLPF